MTLSQPQQDDERLRDAARDAERRGQWGEASAIYQRLSARADASFWDRFLYAYALLNEGKITEANGLVVKLATTAAPKDRGVVAQLAADIAERQDDQAKALALWQEAQRQGAPVYWSLFGEARALMRLKRVRESRDVMARAISLPDAERLGLEFALSLDLQTAQFAAAEATAKRLGIGGRELQRAALAALPGMTSLDERNTMLDTARDIAVEGQFVDLGCGLGSLSAAMAVGLTDNEGARRRGVRVHAIDLFLWEGVALPQVWTDAFPGPQPAPGESFVHLFAHFTAPWRDLIQTIVGDVRSVAWADPISILSIDAMKSVELAVAIITRFVTRMRPGALIFHQDYCFEPTWWIHIYCFLMRDCFEVAKTLPGSSGVLFRMTRSLNDADIKIISDHDVRDASIAEKAFAYSSQLVPEVARVIIEGARTAYYRDVHGREPGDSPSSGAAGTLIEIAPKSNPELRPYATLELLSELSLRLRKDPFEETEQQVSVGQEVWERLGDALEVHLNRFSIRHLRDLFYTFNRLIEAPKPVIPNSTIVDLGSGSHNPLGLLFVFAMLGARCSIAVDLDHVQDWPRAYRAMARSADVMLTDPARIVGDYSIKAEEIKRYVDGFGIRRLATGNGEGIPADRLRFLHASADALPLAAASVDLVTSNAFLEHIPNADQVIAEMARITVPGGFGVHNIDGVDHWSYGNAGIHPLEFLRDPRPGMAHQSNRIRVLEFPDIFRRHGFSVQQVVPGRRIEVSDQLRQSFLEPWRSMPQEWLEVITAVIIVRRLPLAATTNQKP